MAEIKCPKCGEVIKLDKSSYDALLNDVEKEEVISQIKQELQLSRIDQKALTGNVMNLQVIEPVELWLSRIYHSSFVITDSYHGMVFSILFKKPFVVYGNATRGKARFMSVLRKFGLENRYIECCKDLDLKTIKGIIEWNKMHDLLQQKRNESVAFLSNALNS
jgi:exopolysaccharide biosynthesis predicted pyruvyltransferase EpsI